MSVRTLLDERFVIPLFYRLLLGRRVDPSGRAAYGRARSGGAIGRRAIFRAIVASDERAERLRRRTAVRQSGRKLRRNLAASLIRRRPATIFTFVDAVFEAYLDRGPTLGEQNYCVTLIHRRWRRAGSLPSLLAQSVDFARAHDLKPDPILAVHASRMEMVQRCVPPAETIIDLGGAAHKFPEGALLALGYPHKPRRIWIVDLPPGQRLYIDGWSSRSGAEKSRRTVTRDGIEVLYHYGRMDDLSAFADDSTDLVFSGESIEHVSVDEARRTFAEAYRVLRPGGALCLDTPNASVTRIQSPSGLIHPEHKVEYRLEELRRMLMDVGFEIVTEAGVCAVPRARVSGKFDPLELLDGIGLCEDPEDGYLFFIEACKGQELPTQSSASRSSVDQP